jgi:arylsulfatase A-like enzyme
VLLSCRPMDSDRLLTLTTVPVFAGTVAGLYFATVETLANGWVADGYWRNIGVTLAADTAWGVLVGLVGLATIAGPGWWLLRRPGPWLAELAAPGARATTLLIVLLGWTVWAEALHLPRLPLTLPVFAAIGWLVLAVLHRAHARAPLRAEAVAAAFIAVSGLLLVSHGPWAHEALTLGSASTSLLYDESVRDLPPSTMRSLLLAAMTAVAAQAIWAVGARSEAAARVVRWSAVGVVASASLAGRILAMFGGGVTAADPVPVVIIAVDTLRADHVRLGLAGETPNPTTPNIAALADGATVYGAAFSASSWTLPSFGSVVTGRYPHEHGAVSFASWLARGELTLAEVLREAGYTTAAVVSHIFVDSEHGFDQGFDSFDDSLADPSDAMHRRITGGEVTDRALAWLDGRPVERPFMLWVHYFDPHYDYMDHPEWDWATSEGWLAQEDLGLEDLRLKTRFVGPQDLRELRARYDEEVAYTDAQIGRLLEHPALAGAVVVVVADHGEEFMERGWLGHTVSLHPEVARVPLLVRRPGESRVDVSSVVETRGVFGAVLEAVGVPTDAPTLPRTNTRGYALSTVWLDEPAGKRSHLAAWRTDDATLIVDASRGEEWTYDRTLDPTEQRSGAAVPAEHRSALTPVLEALGAADAGERAMSAAEIEQLRALGYL